MSRVRSAEHHDSPLTKSWRVARSCLQPAYNSYHATEFRPFSPKVVQVNHKAKPGESVPARDYFLEHDLPLQFIDHILTEAGVWNWLQSEFDVFQTEMDDEELHQTLRKILAPVYELANGSLDALFGNGFNRHDQEHIDKVVATTRQLLTIYSDQFQLSDETKREVLQNGIIAAHGHDLGNILSRKVHSLISTAILERVLPSTQKNRRRYRTVRRAMQLHNEAVAMEMIEAWDSQSEQPLTSAERIERLRKQFGPEALALIVADKTDIGRHRLSEKAKSQDAVNTDPHLEANLLLENRGISVTRDSLSGKRTVSWNLEFTPGMSEEDVQRYGRFAQPDKPEQAMVSEATHDLHRQFGIPHFSVLDALLWQVYFDKIFLTVESLFALLDDKNDPIESVDIVITDRETFQTITHTFRTETLDEQRQRLRKKYPPVEKLTEPAFRQGKIPPCEACPVSLR